MKEVGLLGDDGVQNAVGMGRGVRLRYFATRARLSTPLWFVLFQDERDAPTPFFLLSRPQNLPAASSVQARHLISTTDKRSIFGIRCQHPDD